MKGIVVEINNKDSIIMTEDGLFTKIKNDNYEVGQTIKLKSSRTFSKLIVGAASMAAALVLCTIGGFAYYTPTDYVSLDVNPSVEYSVNMFDRILDVKAVNDDGEEILSSLDLNNMTIQDAVKETLDKLMADGYLTDDPNSGVVITTSNDEMGEAEELAAQLEQEIQSYLDSQEGIAAEVDAEAVGLERVQEARELGLTPGKLNLIQKLQSSTNGAIEVEDCKDMSVKEINKAIKENRSKNKTKDQLENNDQLEEKDQLKQKDSSSDEDSNEMDDKKGKKDRSDIPASGNDDNLKPESGQNPQNETERINNENKNRGNDQKEQEQEQIKNENQGGSGNPPDKSGNRSQNGNPNKNEKNTSGD